VDENLNNIIERLLLEFKEDKISKEKFIENIKEIYFEDIGFAKIDHHRKLRRGFPEVILGANKTPGQIIEISIRMLKYSDTLLITRIDSDTFDNIKKEIPGVIYSPEGKLAYIVGRTHEDNLIEGVLVICAGTSDISVAEEAAMTSYVMGNKVVKIFDAGIAGIHRLLNYKEELRKANVIIAAAGMEGALPGIVSSLVSCPVIGIPVSVGYGASFKGISPLLTMLNSCSPGLSVVNIDNGFGAGYTASLINKKICGK